MFCNLEPRVQRSWRPCLVLAGFLPLAMAAFAADQPASGPESLWKKLAPFTKPPAEFAGKFGPYQSPLKFADGAIAKSSKDWERRRAEILKTWHERLGPWPPLVKNPTIKKLESIERDGYTEHRVEVQISADGKRSRAISWCRRGRDRFPPWSCRFTSR